MDDDDPFRGIVYVMDSLRYDRLGCKGCDAAVTPTIDALAEDGTNFGSAFSQAIWTYPSAGSIFTGLYPETHGSQQFDRGVDPADPHIADGFADEDVTTACFSTTLGVSPERGFEQQFDEFHHVGEEDAGLRPDVMDLVTDELVSWIEANADEGFFAVVWAMGTHHPFLTPDDAVVEDPSEPLKNVKGVEGTQDWMRRVPRERVDEVLSRYDQAVTYSDRRLGDVVETLEREGIYDGTNLVVTADHGELFDEHARFEQSSPAVQRAIRSVTDDRRRTYYSVFDRSAFVGHQAVYPYDELIHVPLVVKPSEDNRFERGSFDGFVELVDLLPTVFDFADVDVPARVQGRSIGDIIEGPPKTHVYSSSQIHGGNLLYRSVRGRKYKLCQKRLVDLDLADLVDTRTLQSIAAYLLGPRNVLLELPNETVVRAPADRDRLTSVLRSHVEACEASSSDESRTRVDVDEETKAHLENLGYK